MFSTLVHVGAEGFENLAHAFDFGWKFRVAEVLQLRNRQITFSHARITDDEDLIAVLDSTRRQREEIGALGRIIFVIRAQNGDVELVTWIAEIIVFPAERAEP